MVLEPLFAIRSLQQSERSPPAVLQDLQLEKLKRLLQHVYETVPYYRRLFREAGLRPDDVKSLGDLRRLPITTRTTLQSLPTEELRSSRIRESSCRMLHSSGSSGIPLSFPVTRRHQELRMLLNLRHMFAHGLRCWHKLAIVLDSRMIPKHPRWFQRFGLLRRYYVPASLDPRKQVELLERVSPDALNGFSASLFLIAEELARRPRPKLRPRLIFTTGQVLSSQARSLIENVFGTRLVDVYGTVETADIAWQCSEFRDLHVNVEHLIVEILDGSGNPVGPGREGTVVCTNLDAYEAPFIRYRVGDIAVAGTGPCPCGRTLPTIAEVRGRENDLIIYRSGRRQSASILLHVMKYLPGVLAYRIIQGDYDRLRVEIIPKPGFDPAICDRIAREMESRLLEPMRVGVETVRSLPQDPSGKMRAFICQVPVAETQPEAADE